MWCVYIMQCDSIPCVGEARGLPLDVGLQHTPFYPLYLPLSLPLFLPLLALCKLYVDTCALSGICAFPALLLYWSSGTCTLTTLYGF